MGELWVTVSERDAGLRLDAFLGRLPEIGSRSQAALLIASGAVTVNETRRPKSYLVTSGDRICVSLPDRVPLLQPASECGTVPIVYEDEWLLVADKPAGMPVHPSPGHSSGTLVHALLNHGVAGGEAFRPGIVHRLDKDTSGLIVAAKSPEIHRRLSTMIRHREIDRRYLALVHGQFAGHAGTIEAPIGRDPVRRKVMTVGGVAPREARTHFLVLERLGEFTLLEARLETGRTHQIRVHFLAIGHPVAGDPVYARRNPLGLERQFLHSHRLSFVHPVTGQSVELVSPLPADLVTVLDKLRAGMSSPR
ncbi:MAG: RluA family pseudouridine synthase [Thermoleophilia bacterium]|nr:RluA family pseudouridine synthase [Thermoleophilia bacterium]